MMIPFIACATFIIVTAILFFAVGFIWGVTYEHGSRVRRKIEVEDARKRILSQTQTEER